MALWQELKQRNVVKVGAVYLAASWLIIQVVALISEPLGLPEQFDTIVIVALGIGFPIALIIAWAFELTPEGIRRTDTLSSTERTAPAVPSGRFNLVVTGILALAVAFLAVDRFILEDNSSTASSVADQSAAASGDSGSGAPALEDRIRVAVLPLRALSADEELRYFTDGLSEQLIYELREIPELLVPDPGASFAFRGSDRSNQDIAARLGVSYVLDGSLAANGEDLRISVSLERIADSAQLWEARFDVSRADLFDVQDEIREQVATSLSVRLGVLTRRDAGATDNVEAYTAYLTGLGYGQRYNPESMRTAEQLFKRAIALDPNFVPPRVALYFTLAQLPAFVPEADGASARQEAEEVLALLSEQAPELDAVGMVNALRGYVEGNWADVAAFLNRQRSDPDRTTDDSQNYANMGTLLTRVGRIEDAIRELETARALAPQDSNIAFMLASAYEDAGRFDAALAEAQRGIELAPGDETLRGFPLLIALARRDPDVLARTIAENGTSLPLWAELGALIDDPDAGIAEVRRRFEERVEETPLAVGLLAHWANFFGDPELALEIVRSLPNGTAFMALMIWDSGMRDARRLPEFHDLVTDMGFVSYWREYGWPDFCHPIGDDFECE
jgi:TolB-like protein